MNNKILFQYIILSLIVNSLIANNVNSHELLKTADRLEKINQVDDALTIYMQLFYTNQSNSVYFKKIKKILLEKKAYEELILIYKQYISNLNSSEDKFLNEIELLEIKIWNQSINWEKYLIEIIDKYILNNEEYNYGIKKNKFKYIIQRLIKNEQKNKAYELVIEIRKYFKKELENNNSKQNNLSYKDTIFLAREMISIFSKDKQYKNAIEESILFLKNNQKNHFYNTLKEQIFIFSDKIIEKRAIVDFDFPITNKQFNANTFFNYKSLKKYNTDDINYVINIYNKLIQHDIAKNESKLKLADINYNILNDLDNAYQLYDQLETKNIDISFKASINKIDILITKGYLDSASALIKNNLEKIETLGFVYKKDQIINDFHNKNIQILFYKGNYLEMKENLDLLIDNTKLENKYLNDLIEIKNIVLFFNQDEESFKKYSSIQHKIKMNKDFEATFELIQLINSENILISELSQFQYALIQIKKGNIEEAQTIISSMSHKTIFSEIALIINAEIEDHLNKNYENSIKLYEELLNKYPSSMYKENIRKRLNIINELTKERIDS